MAEMRLMMEYFCQFDGNKSWDEVEPVVQKTFHQDMVVTDGREKFERQEFIERLKNFVETGGSIQVLQLNHTRQGVRYEIVFHEPDGTSKKTKTIGMFEAGKLIKVQRDTIRRGVAIL